MSEGLEKSRSHILGDGLDQMHRVDSQSQKDFVVLKKQSKNNVTLDSGQPTASGGETKASKHDMSGSATDIN